MDPRLLKLYNSELRHLRDVGAEFANEFPKIAGRLGMDGMEVADPYGKEDGTPARQHVRTLVCHLPLGRVELGHGLQVAAAGWQPVEPGVGERDDHRLLINPVRVPDSRGGVCLP